MDTEESMGETEETQESMEVGEVGRVVAVGYQWQWKTLTSGLNKVRADEAYEEFATQLDVAEGEVEVETVGRTRLAPRLGRLMGTPASRSSLFRIHGRSDTTGYHISFFLIVFPFDTEILQ